MHSCFQTLVADLEGDTHGDFEDLLVALVTPPDVYDCQEVVRAIKVGLTGQDEDQRVQAGTHLFPLTFRVPGPLKAR